MKKIVCYGDSNTWGYDPETNSRMDRHTRWPGVMGDLLGEGYEVVEEGLPSRTTCWDDPTDSLFDGSDKNGKRYLVPCVCSHAPLDLLIIMLGTNDLKTRFNLSASEIAHSAASLVGTARAVIPKRKGEQLKVLLVAPPPLPANLNDGAFLQGHEKSRRFADEFRMVAKQWQCDWLDAGAVVEVKAKEGIHFGVAQHRKLGEALAARVKECLETAAGA
ncbi:MAG: SGNH/GDSL hydrolase family protein [Phycisphaeraceae bacterium]|nr:SGNH/GDSL hydrolase family protein [Phycisphaeraceae bacterium]